MTLGKLGQQVNADGTHYWEITFNIMRCQSPLHRNFGLIDGSVNTHREQMMEIKVEYLQIEPKVEIHCPYE